MLDGAAFVGLPIRVYLRKMSQKDDVAPNERCPGPEAVYRVTEDEESDSSSSQVISTRKSETREPTTAKWSDSACTFQKFQQLPPELRMMVWNYHLDSRPTRYVQLEWRGWQNGFHSRTPVPVVLQINRELRYEAQKRWPLLFASRRIAPKIRFNSSIDVLYLTNSPNRKALDGLTLRRLLDQVPQEELNNIKKIYFNIGLWFTPRLRDRPTVEMFRTQLPSLTHIVIVMSNGLDTDEDGSAWIDFQPFDFKSIADFSYDAPHVGRTRFKRCYRIIKRYFDNEAQAFPEWNLPSISPAHVTRGGHHLELNFASKF